MTSHENPWVAFVGILLQHYCVYAYATYNKHGGTSRRQVLQRTCSKNGTGRSRLMPASDAAARNMLPSEAREAAAMAMPASGSLCDN